MKSRTIVRNVASHSHGEINLYSICATIMMTDHLNVTYVCINFSLFLNNSPPYLSTFLILYIVFLLLQVLKKSSILNNLFSRQLMKHVSKVSGKLKISSKGSIFFFLCSKCPKHVLSLSQLDYLLLWKIVCKYMSTY